MAIYLKENPYQGVNAHLNSFLQSNYDNWHPFHAKHIIHIADKLNQYLPEGYYAIEEKSLQIQMNFENPRQTRPDVGIYAETLQPALSANKLIHASPILEIAADAVALYEEDDLIAITIYKFVEGRSDIPVTRIELFSPSNKVTASDTYLALRRRVLATGVRLVEIDYLHQSKTLFLPTLSDYTQHAEGSYPFIIAITDPTPVPASSKGITRFYGFHVDDPIANIPIPLLDDDLPFDFGQVYHFSYANFRPIHHAIDYSQLPINFHTYSPVDQERIHQRMGAIQTEHQNK